MVVATVAVKVAGPAAQNLSWADSARELLFQSLFTNLCGVTVGDWWGILQHNRFAIAPSRWLRAAILSAGSLLNSYYRRKEVRLFNDRLADVAIQPPVFILGHWRSGTTLLHNLLSLDDRFAFPNLYEVFFPHTFLCTEDERTGLVAPLIPRTRAFDNVAQGLDMPNEDEFATAAASLVSPYLWWAFPRSGDRYENYLSFHGVPEPDVERWRSAFLRFLKKLTLRYDRPLLLKSPPHTARVRLLLDLFPEARFIHVHRDPYTVFRSTLHLNDVLTRSLSFQGPSQDEPEETVIRRYRLMHDAYFDDRPLVSAGQLHEIAFTDLERDPVGSLAQAYKGLDLGGFEQVEPALEQYAEGQAGYRKNTYPSLDSGLRARIRSEWSRSFEEWGYQA